MHINDRYQWLKEQADKLAAGDVAGLDAANLAEFLRAERDKIRRDLIGEIGYNVCRALVRWLLREEHTNDDGYFVGKLLPLYVSRLYRDYINASPSLSDEIEECWREAWASCAKHHNRRGGSELFPLEPLWSYAFMLEPFTEEKPEDMRDIYAFWLARDEPTVAVRLEDL